MDASIERVRVWLRRVGALRQEPGTMWPLMNGEVLYIVDALDAAERERDEAHVVAARLRDDLAILAADIAAHREAIEEARAEAELLRRELAEARADRDALKGALSRANELRIGDRAEARLDERWACSEFAEKWLREVDEITQDTPADLADAIRARGNGGAP